MLTGRILVTLCRFLSKVTQRKTLKGITNQLLTIKTNKVMTNDYELECAVMEIERMRASRELRKRVPNIAAVDGKRILFCIVQARIDAYKEQGIKKPLTEIVAGCGITAPTYYNLLEKYNSVYKQCKKF